MREERGIDNRRHIKGGGDRERDRGRKREGEV